MSLSPVVRPPALRDGDCIGLAAPASAFKEEELSVGVRVLQDLGFRVRYTPRVFEQYRYLAGSDAARAAELQTLFADPTIQAIFCCRGGYGSQRLLPYLDTAVIKANPRKRVHVFDEKLLPATSKAVERGNRRHWKMQKSVYWVRSKGC